MEKTIDLLSYEDKIQLESVYLAESLSSVTVEDSLNPLQCNRGYSLSENRKYDKKEEKG